MRLGKRLQYTRELEGLTQSELAVRAGCRRASISEIEADKQKDLKFSVVVRLADVLGVSLDFLAGRPPTHPPVTKKR